MKTKPLRVYREEALFNVGTQRISLGNAKYFGSKVYLLESHGDTCGGFSVEFSVQNSPEDGTLYYKTEMNLNLILSISFCSLKSNNYFLVGIGIIKVLKKVLGEYGLFGTILKISYVFHCEYLEASTRLYDIYTLWNYSKYDCKIFKYLEPWR